MPKPSPKDSRDDVVNVARAREPGVTFEQIATDFGFHTITLSKWMRAAGVAEGVKPGATSDQRIHLNGALSSELNRKGANGIFQKALTRVRQLRVERWYMSLSVQSMDDPPDEVSYDVDRDNNNIEDLYKPAKRKRPEGVANNYWNYVTEHQSDDDYDPTEAKAATAVLALRKPVVEAVESASEQLVRTWLKTHQRDISKPNDAKKAQCEPVKRETRTPELTDLILPMARTISGTDQPWAKHVPSCYSTPSDTYRFWTRIARLSNAASTFSVYLVGRCRS